MRSHQIGTCGYFDPPTTEHVSPLVATDLLFRPPREHAEYMQWVRTTQPRVWTIYPWVQGPFMARDGEKTRYRVKAGREVVEWQD